MLEIRLGLGILRRVLPGNLVNGGPSGLTDFTITSDF
jgi:hypothetical protein